MTFLLLALCILLVSLRELLSLCVPSFLKFYDVPFSRSPVFNFHGHSLCTFRLKTYVLQCLEVLKLISLILSPQFNFSSFSGTSFKWWKDSLIVFFFPLLWFICDLHIFYNSLCLVLSFPDKYFSLSSFYFW